MENIFRIELNFFGFFIVGIVVWLFHKRIEIKSRKSQVFLKLTYFTAIELILDSIFWIIDCRHFFLDCEINILVNSLYYTFQILQCYEWKVYCEIHMTCKENKVGKYLMMSVLAVGIILLIVNLWTGCIFSVNEVNVYQRSWGLFGNLEAICCLFYPCYCIGLVIIKIIIGDKRQRRDGGYLILVSIIPIISTILQMIFYGLNFIWVGMAMALLLILIEFEVRQYQKKEQELMEQRIKIMLSQIQPHFLYNALCVIQDLAHEKAPEAEEATIEFARFLRGNLDSMSERQPIAFEKELSHTQNYLALEKKRFKKRLTVEYKIETRHFRIPALTLQPIVENAVRYGVCQRKEGGTVWISSQEDKNHFIITVKDNGVGFDVMQPKQDGRTHIGISNVRARLERLCHGTLDITSTENIGTIAIITIPKKER